MFRKALVCTDLSEASDCLVNCVGQLRAVGLEEALLAHVIYVANTPSLEVMLAEEAAPALERQKKLLEDQRISVFLEMPTGIPSYTLNELAEKHDVSLIVIGSHGGGILRRAVLGSVSYELLHHATRPVFLGRIEIMGEEGECRSVCADLFSNVLFPTDFSETSARAFDYLTRMVEGGAKRFTLLHVQDQTRISGHLEDRLEEFNRIDQDRLEELKVRLVAEGAVDVQIDILYGTPTGEILGRVKENDFSLIVMGSQGRGFIPELFLGSVSHNVVRHAPVPVLLVPAAR